MAAGEAVMPGQGKVTERAYTPAEPNARSPISSTAIDPAHSRHSGASRNPEAPGTLEQARKTEPGHPAAQPTSADLPAQGNTIAVLGDTTYDIYLNDRAYWRNVPANVWRYKLGGYQVLKKWLSYREHTILKRPLKPEEVQHFTDTARRIVGYTSCLTHSEPEALSVWNLHSEPTLAKFILLGIVRLTMKYLERLWLSSARLWQA